MENDSREIINILVHNKFLMATRMNSYVTVTMLCVLCWSTVLVKVLSGARDKYTYVPSVPSVLLVWVWPVA